MQELKKLGILSVANISLLFGVIFGLVAGIYFASISGILPAEQAALMGAVGLMFSWWAVIILPIVYGLLYFVGGLLTAVLYNLFASKVGGVMVELDAGSVKKSKKK